MTYKRQLTYLREVQSHLVFPATVQVRSVARLIPFHPRRIAQHLSGRRTLPQIRRCSGIRMHGHIPRSICELNCTRILKNPSTLGPWTIITTRGMTMISRLVQRSNSDKRMRSMKNLDYLPRFDNIVIMFIFVSQECCLESSHFAR